MGKEFRRQGREPIDAAEPLEEIQEPSSLEASPLVRQSAVKTGDPGRALERIPDTYREPLILFIAKRSRLNA